MFKFLLLFIALFAAFHAGISTIQVLKLQLLLSEKLESWIFDEDRFIFFCIFDFNSDFNRKNILVMLQIYISAFQIRGRDASSVGLVLKSMNGENQPNDFKAVLDAISGVPHITLIDRVLPDDILNQFRAIADCFISLHRSEGWGLNIIEELLSGHPVIVSSYGGSDSYIAEAYAVVGISELLIPVIIVNVSRLFGPYEPGMTWGEPHFGAATFAMRQVYLYRDYYKNRASAIQQIMLSYLSPYRTGIKMKMRLDSIAECLNNVQNQSKDIKSC